MASPVATLVSTFLFHGIFKKRESLPLNLFQGYSLAHPEHCGAKLNQDK
jgi:hypothetical protein